MQERKSIRNELDLIAQELRELEICFEKYFSGEEKRAPLKKREALQQKLRRVANRRIIQTDLRFRFESLSSRYFSYSTHWDRILRLMDEGRFVRHLGGSRSSKPEARNEAMDESEKVYQQLLKAHADCALAEPPPDRQKFSAFLARQREALQGRYGEREIEFRVVSENGKPKIKVKAKD